MASRAFAVPSSVVKLPDLAANGSVTLHTQTGAKYLILFVSGNSAVTGMYYDSVASNGISVFTPILAASGISFTVSSANAPVINNSVGSSATIYAILLSGHSIY